jgi:16S rRNA processing protein RimM
MEDIQALTALAMQLWPDHVPEELEKELLALVQEQDAAFFLALENGREVGKLVEIMERPASNIYVVKGDTEHLIPAVPEFIMSTDAEAGIITVRLIEGM